MLWDDKLSCASCVFDVTRQAHAGAELLELQRTTAVTHFPEELFMIMRVVTIIRGLLGSMHVDVSAAKVRKMRDGFCLFLFFYPHPPPRVLFTLFSTLKQ